MTEAFHGINVVFLSPATFGHADLPKTSQNIPKHPKTIVAFAGVAEPVSVPFLFAGQIIWAHVGPKADELEEVENQDIQKYL